MKTRLFLVFLIGVSALFHGCYTQLALPDQSYSSYRDYEAENDQDEQSYGDETAPEPEYSDTTYDSEDNTIINNYYFDDYHPSYRRFFGYYHPGVTISFGYSSYYDFCWDPWWYVTPFYPHIIFYPYPHYYYYYYPWNYYGWHYYGNYYGSYYDYTPRYKYRNNDITRLRGGRDRRSSVVTGGRDLLSSRETKRIPTATVDSRERKNILDDVNPSKDDNTRKNGLNDDNTRLRDIKRMILGDTESGTGQKNRRSKTDNEITPGKDPAKNKKSAVDNDNSSGNSEPRITKDKNSGNKRTNPYVTREKKKSITNDGSSNTRKEDKPSFTPRKNDQPRDSNSGRETPKPKYDTPKRDNPPPKYDPPKRETPAPRYNPPRNDNPPPRSSNPPSRSSSPRNDDGGRRR